MRLKGRLELPVCCGVPLSSSTCSPRAAPALPPPTASNPRNPTPPPPTLRLTQPPPEQKPVLTRRVRESYAAVKPDVDALIAWLADPANEAAPVNTTESRKLLIGLDDPEQNTPIEALQNTVRRC